MIYFGLAEPSEADPHRALLAFLRQLGEAARHDATGVALVLDELAPALEEFFGTAAGLSASVVTRLTTA